jgi:hypothetical protein
MEPTEMKRIHIPGFSLMYGEKAAVRNGERYGAGSGQ